MSSKEHLNWQNHLKNSKFSELQDPEQLQEIHFERLFPAKSVSPSAVVSILNFEIISVLQEDQ